MKPSPSNHLSKLYFRNIKLIHQSAMAVIFLCYLLFAGVLPFAVADTLQELGDRLISNTELNTPQKKVAEVVFKICSTFPDPANDSQEDFLNRCSEVVVHGMESEKAAALFQMDTIETDTMGTTTVEISATQFAHIAARLASLRNGSGGAIALSIDGKTLDPMILLAAVDHYSDAGSGMASGNSPIGGKWGAFLNASIGTGDADATDLEPGFDFDTKGITGGIDYKMSPNLILGVALGYGMTESDIDLSAGELEVDGYGAALYGTYYINNFYLDLMGFWGSREYDLARHVHYSITASDGGMTDVDQTFLGETDSDEISLSISGGYDVRLGAWTVGPYARLNYLDATIDGYEESLNTDNMNNGYGLGVKVEDQDLESLTSTLGLQLTYATTMGWGVLTPYLRLDWTHEYQNDSQTIQASFINDYHADDEKIMIAIPTNDPDEDYFNFGIGFAATLPHGIMAFFDYETIIGLNEITSHLFSGGIRLEF